jgi:ATP-dependent DNA helicase RecG
MATGVSLLREVVGGRTAKALEQSLGLVTVSDLLRHYPRRFAEHGELTDLSQLVEGEEATVQAEVVRVQGRRIPGRKLHILEVTIRSGSHQASLTFFNQPWRDKELLPGRQGFFAGKVSRFRSKLQLNSPDYILIDAPDGISADEFASSMIAVYPAASGVPSWTVSRCVDVVLKSLDLIEDPLPAALLDSAALPSLDWAVRHIHRPAGWAEYGRARRRLAFDEAFGVQLVLGLQRAAAAALPTTSRPYRAGGLVDAFDERLPFELTGEQRTIAALLGAELGRTSPMQRLLQGEVGSGKTVLALRAMLQVVDAGGQAALLAPTEVLAAQHQSTVLNLMGELARAGELGGSDRGTRVVLLTGSMSAAARRRALLEIASGEAGIVIGTHALIQDHVQFAHLGLIVVDEQHRFGVEQRDALRAKASASPHLLVMTATPIPRTVAITVFGDLEVSELRELPAGRTPVTTAVVPVLERPGWLSRAWELVHEEVARGRQVYVVCPRIGEAGEQETTGQRTAGSASDDMADDDGDGSAADLGSVDPAEESTPAASVLGSYAELSDGVLSDLRLAMMHGRLPADEKSAVMSAFSAGRYDVLVATTVIEVGVDVPNASVMIIVDADRFGVSQLHQLRGRIGRGHDEGPNTCLLLTRARSGQPSLDRLQAVAATGDGFELARLDLEQRREGDVLGAAQSGRRSRLRLLSLLRDEELILSAREHANAILAVDPALRTYPELLQFVSDSLDSSSAEYLQKA